jgi:uncharacterized protein (TIGR03437 family)
MTRFHAWLLLSVVAVGISWSQSASFQPNQTSLLFTAIAGAAPAPIQTLNLSGNTVGLTFSVALSAPWLTVSPVSGAIPSTLQVAVDITNLQPGSYSATIKITAPQAAPATQQVMVLLTVQPAQPPRLGVSSTSLTFNVVQGAAAAGNTLGIFNRGSGTLAFAASVTSDRGWLSASPASATISAAQPGAVTVTANPAGLHPGVYTGLVTVNSSTSNESSQVLVALTIAPAQANLLLSQSGLTFTGVSGGGSPLPQMFGILNIGQGALNWTARVISPTGGTVPWVSISPASGVVSRPYLDVSFIEVTTSPGALAPGDYYAQILVSAPNTSNSPQTVTLLLSVLPAGGLLPPGLSPTSLIFTGVPGVGPPSQNFQVAVPGLQPLDFSSGRLTLDGQNWFKQSPVSGTVYPDQPVTIGVQPNFSALGPGVYSGVITIQFADGHVSTEKLLTVVAPSATAGTLTAHAAGSCGPSQLTIQFTNQQSNFSATVAKPTPLEVQVVDDCGNPVTSSPGSAVVAGFSNGDLGLNLVHTAQGKWGQTWQPHTAGNPVTVSVTAFMALESGKVLANQVDATVNVSAAGPVPLVSQGAIVNAASFASGGTVAPGSLVSIFGSQLADTTVQASDPPLVTTLGNAEVRLGSESLPLLFSSNGQINAQLPYDVAVDTQLQIVIRRGGQLSVPVEVVVATAQPAIFTQDFTGHGAGVIVNAVTNVLNTPSAPATAGDIVTIYCTGLGTVSPEVPPGAGATGPTPTDSPVTANIGGIAATVQYAGLTPGFPGLYQVNAIVPEGVTAGDSIPVVLLVNGQSSPAVTMSMR